VNGNDDRAASLGVYVHKFLQENPGLTTFIDFYAIPPAEDETLRPPVVKVTLDEGSKVTESFVRL